MTDIRARIDDEELEEFLDGCENQSEAVREGLRIMAAREAGRDFPGLSDAQTKAYRWLLDNVGVGQQIEVEIAKSYLAQVTSLKSELMRRTVFEPLRKAGYLRVQRGRSEVGLLVCAPSEGDSEGDDGGRGGRRASGVSNGPSASEVREEAGETFDRLEAAEPATDGGVK